MSEDSFRTEDRNLRQRFRSLASFIRRHSRCEDPPLASRLDEIAINFLSISANNQNSPDYADDDQDTYPEDYPTEIEESDDFERDWRGETYFGKGVPDYDFKWGRVESFIPSERFGRSVVSDSPSKIQKGLDRGVKQRSGGVSIKDRKYNKRIGLWTMKVTSGGPVYTVKVKAQNHDGGFFRGSTFWNSDVRVSCSCPYWRWNGPEFHGKGKGYLKDKPRGTASPPDIQDPQRNSFVCKHVYKVFQDIKGMEEKTRRKRKR